VAVPTGTGRGWWWWWWWWWVVWGVCRESLSGLVFTDMRGVSLCQSTSAVAVVGYHALHALWNRKVELHLLPPKISTLTRNPYLRPRPSSLPPLALVTPCPRKPFLGTQIPQTPPLRGLQNSSLPVSSSSSTTTSTLACAPRTQPPRPPASPPGALLRCAN
jgi:hypothetical protein